jgi:radical SAM superfamily enzyme
LHRLTGDAAAAELLAPERDFDKNEIRAGLADVLRGRGSFQGARSSNREVAAREPRA